MITIEVPKAVLRVQPLNADGNPTGDTYTFPQPAAEILIDSLPPQTYLLRVDVYQKVET